MKSAKIATIVSTLAVILLMANHALIGRITREAMGQGNGAVTLPAPVVFLIKLGHFFEYYYSVLIPFLWLTTFLFCVLIRAWLKVPDAKETPEIGPVDP
jgi:hypothetical protein